MKGRDYMMYKKGHTYACFHTVGRKQLFDSDIGSYDGIFDPRTATLKWKSLCEKIIDRLAKDYGTKYVTVYLESHTNCINDDLFTTECTFFVDGSYVGYATLTFWNRV